jgi:cysteine desulfurase
MEWFTGLFNTNKRIYLDYAAATPLLPEVRRAMEKYWSREFYNPNAIYAEGERVRREVDEYRTKIARILGVAKESVHFTSGGTEANVLAVRGVKEGKVLAEPDAHPSVLDSIRKTESKELVLVSSVVPDNALGREIRAERKKNNSEYPLLHVDASQTAAYYDVSPEKLAADMVTLDAAKLGGPKGIGALIVRRGVTLDLPPRGTPAVPLIAGFAQALEIAVRDREAERKRLLSLSEGFKAAVEKNLPGTEVSLTPPHIVNVSVPGLLPELLVLALDRRGILVSAGPACNSNKPEPAETPVRFSFGRATTEKELNKAVEILCQEVKNLVK